MQLKKYEVKSELLTDIDMLLMVEKDMIKIKNRLILNIGM